MDDRHTAKAFQLSVNNNQVSRHGCVVMVRGFDLVLVGILVIVVPFAILFFLALGPVGWLLIGGGLIVAGIIQTILGDDDAETAAIVAGVNCQECGARNDAHRNHCEYCGSVLDVDRERSGPDARE